MRARLAAIVLVVLLLRLPFLNQAVQGDDYNYLAGAMHAQVDPLRPTNFQYVFLGKMVDARGHPHPPLNIWALAALLAVFGDVHEVPFHAAYIVFSLIAALAMWSLARRFSPAPAWATLLFLATPAFVVNGNSFETDVPHLAFWMASAALYVAAADRRSRPLLCAAAFSMALAGLTAYQAAALVPILGVYLWMRRRSWAPGWAVLLAPVLAPGAWQLYERAMSGSAPAAVLAGYLAGFGFQTLSSKLQNAVALTVHAGWLVFPALAWAAFGRAGRWIWMAAGAAALAGALLADPHPLFWLSVGTGVLALAWCAARLVRREDPDAVFLAVWTLIFFGGALALFFAGSARYLLPIAAPAALLVSRQLAGRKALLAAGVAAQALVGLGLSAMNYQHWDAYRSFVAGLRSEFEHRRVWINAEWALRYYAEAEGGLPLIESQPVRPGEVVLTSKIAYPVSFTTGGGVLTPLAAKAVTSDVPLRTIGLGVKSAYSTVTLGYRPFDFVLGPIDEVVAQAVVERKPELSYLPMNAPEAESQIVSGVYQLEDGKTRWMSDRAVILLKSPPDPQPIRVELYLAGQAPARQVSASIDGNPVAEARYEGPGLYTLWSAAPVKTGAESASLEIAVDRAFSPPGDRRTLGMILIGAGFSSR
ncbi:MAG: glycosyltransferase family 39 protein [Bryobacteraceae bacterium]|nr:glycosyltransferase family 39 protein [Bryobacteraceae bacterium]